MPQTADSAVIKVIGVGGCGGNALNHMMARGLSGVAFIVADTNIHPLEQSKAPITLLLGSVSIGCTMAGSRIEIGRRAALSDRDRLVTLIRGVDLLLIVAGMGGSTGTGAAPVIAEIAREMDILTVAVVTQPFLFEGGRRLRATKIGIEELREKVDSLIVVPNEKLMKTLDEDVSMGEVFAASDDALYQAVSGIVGVINGLKFADERDVMRLQGCHI